MSEPVMLTSPGAKVAEATEFLVAVASKHRDDPETERSMRTEAALIMKLFCQKTGISVYPVVAFVVTMPNDKAPACAFNECAPSRQNEQIANT